MRRRGFLASSAAALALSPESRAQQDQAPRKGRVPRVIYLSFAPGPSPRSQAFQQGLAALGYVDGQTINIDYRWYGNDVDQARNGVRELAAAGVDVLVSAGPKITAVAAKATSTIPIVMAGDYDPVGAGFVASLARPG